MAKSIIEEPDEFSIWCSDEQGYTTFGRAWSANDPSDFVYIQQAGFGYPHSFEQIKALHEWLGSIIENSKHQRHYELLNNTYQGLSDLEAQKILDEIAQLERELGYSA